MPLAVRALNPIPIFGLTCHAATFYWAGEEAQAQGWTAVKSPVQRGVAISNLPNGVQNTILMFRPLRKWNLAVQGLPAAGSIVLWGQAPTHSAVVTAAGLTGYNQNCIRTNALPHNGHSTAGLADLKPTMNDCFVIDGNQFVQNAAVLGL